MRLPMVCPECGELIIAAPAGDGRPELPEHPDRIEPTQTCPITIRDVVAQRQRQA